MHFPIPVLAQVDPAVVASLLSMGPQGLAALAIAGCVWMYIQTQKLHAEHVELLKSVIPVAQKLAEQVEKLQVSIDRAERNLDNKR